MVILVVMVWFIKMLSKFKINLQLLHDEHSNLKNEDRKLRNCRRQLIDFTQFIFHHDDVLNISNKINVDVYCFNAEC